MCVKSLLDFIYRPARDPTGCPVRTNCPFRNPESPFQALAIERKALTRDSHGHINKEIYFSSTKKRGQRWEGKKW